MNIDFFKKSIIVVAHPDDEILWFGSIVQYVAKIIICFLPFNKDNFLSFKKKYPLKNVKFLNLEPFNGYHRINFICPIYKNYGLLIKNSPSAFFHYKRNFYLLKEILLEHIPDNFIVFTHNIWGEYGHEEHIQVSKVINAIAKGKNLKIWYPSYASLKTYNLVKKIIFRKRYNLLKIETPQDFLKKMKNLYLKYDLWTFDPNWTWPKQDFFFQFKENALLKYRETIPIRFLNVRW